MSRDTLKTVGWWILALSVIALVAYGVHSCNKREETNKKQAKLERILHGEYVYEDVNGVYHIDEHCRMLRKHFYDAEENEVYENYSSEYMPRSIITSWRGFASTHQLCTKCFSPGLVHQLDSVRIVLQSKGRDRGANPRAARDQYRNGWVPSNDPSEEDLIE